MRIALVSMAVCAIWILYEAWKAPLMDDDYDRDDSKN